MKKVIFLLVVLINIIIGMLFNCRGDDKQDTVSLLSNVTSNTVNTNITTSFSKTAATTLSTNMTLTTTTQIDNRPVINGITPSNGVNFRSVKIIVNGTNFDNSCEIKLYSDIDGYIDAMSGSNTFSETEITCHFDLSYKTAGTYDVILNRGDGESYTLTDGFVINEVVYDPGATASKPQWYVTMPSNWGNYTSTDTYGPYERELDPYTVVRNGITHTLSGNQFHLIPTLKEDGTASGYFHMAGTTSLPFTDELFRTKLTLDVDSDGDFFDWDTGGAVETDQFIEIINGTSFSQDIFFPYGTGEYRVAIYLADSDYTNNTDYFYQLSFYVINNKDTLPYVYLFPSIGARSDDGRLFDLSQQIVTYTNAQSVSEIALAVHDWLGWFMRYDQSSNPNRRGRVPSKKSIFDIHGYLTDLWADPKYTLEERNGYHWGVCRDYATFYTALMRCQGIECWFEASSTGAHVWNVVRDNSVEYRIDVTWDAVDYDDYDDNGNGDTNDIIEGLIHDYFQLPPHNNWSGHSWGDCVFRR